MSALGEYIKRAIEQHERESNINFLKKIPENTFWAIFEECDRNAFSGCVYNDKYYNEWEIYIAYLERDSDNEPLL